MVTWWRGLTGLTLGLGLSPPWAPLYLWWGAGGGVYFGGGGIPGRDRQTYGAPIEA